MTTPHRNMLMSKMLMAGQYDRSTPQDTTVTERGAIAPFGTYANGQTGLAWPGILAEPVQSANNLRLYGYNAGAGDTQGVEDAFNVAGAAMLGGIAAPRPRNSLGALSGRIQQQIHHAQSAANPDVDPYKLAQSARFPNGSVTVSSPAGNINAYFGEDGLRIKGSNLDKGIETGKGYGSPLYDAAARFASSHDVPLNSDGVVSPLAQRMYERFRRSFPVDTNPSARRQRFGTMETPDRQPVYTVDVPPSGARPPPLPDIYANGGRPGAVGNLLSYYGGQPQSSWLDHIRPGDI